jgi:telomerase Cajal body protein 1
MPQSDSIVDYAWYPRATIQDPASFCFVASVRESPVKLLDASDGRLRASYRIVDHRERQIAPHSLAFNFATDKYASVAFFAYDAHCCQVVLRL